MNSKQSEDLYERLDREAFFDNVAYPDQVSYERRERELWKQHLERVKKNEQ